MKAIKITYTVDNNSWSDGRFEDEPERTLLISMLELRELISSKLNVGEFLHEVYDVSIIR